MEQAAKVTGESAAGESKTNQAAGSRAKAPGRLMKRSFFAGHPRQVAPALLGKLLVRLTEKGPIAGRIIEAEAYLGPHNTPPDPAAHSHRGPTPRNQVLFGPPGHAYVYSIYGMYYCMNVTCEPEGKAGCILLRALEPVGKFSVEQMALNRGLTRGANIRQLASGPSRLCLALGLTRKLHNALDLLDPASPLQLRDDGFNVEEVAVTTRIGIKHAIDWPLRFIIAGHACASGTRKMNQSLTGI